jgi:hypothetical protein
MSKTKCCSVRLDMLCEISEKAYKATAFDGSEDIIPKSCVFGRDYDVHKSDAYWIAEWILAKKNLQYSCKKTAWFDDNGKMLPTYTVSKHAAEKVNNKEAVPAKELER